MSAGFIDAFLELVRSNLSVFMTFIPLAGSIVGLVGMAIAMRRVLPPDDVSARWRYRSGSFRVPSLGTEVGNVPARRIARWLIGIAIAVPLVLGLLGATAPGGPSPMFDGAYWHQNVVPWVGWVGYAIGLTWMIRIYRRSYDEPRDPTWRYRF